MLQRDVCELGAHDSLGNLAPQARSLQHVGLVDRGQFATPLAREARGHPDDTFDFLHGVRADIDRAVGIAALFAEIDSASQLSHKQEIDALEDLGLQSRGVDQTRQDLHGTQVGVDAQFLAQPQESLFGAHFRTR